MFAVERLAADVALLDRFIASCPVPHLGQEFVEPRQLCALLLSPRVSSHSISHTLGGGYKAKAALPSRRLRTNLFR